MQTLLSLHDLPGVVVYALFMGVAGGLAGLCCALFAPLVRAPQSKEMLDIAMRTTGAVTAALTLTLAFCAVQARSQITDAQRLVHAEAAAIAGLARLAHRLGAQGEAITPVIAAYLGSVAHTELPSMAMEGRHPETQRQAEALEMAVHIAAGLLGGSFADDLLQEADAVEAAREARLRAAQGGLPEEFWMLIALLMALTMATGPLYPPRPHVMAMLGIQSAGLGALVAFVFLMDRPFRSPLGVSAEAYALVLNLLQHRTGLGNSVRLLLP
jgi:hypothetical protein